MQKLPDYWFSPPTNENKGETHLGEVETLVNGIDSPYGLCLRLVGTRHIVYQMGVYQCQIMITENLCWGV